MLLCVVFVAAALLAGACGHVQLKLETSPTATSNLGTVAYVRGGDIWVRALPNGSASRLSTDGINRAPLWSPSGKWLAFFKGKADLWVMRRDGSDTVRLGAATQARWAHNSDQLGFVAGISESRTGLSVADPETGRSVSAILSGDGPGGTGVLSFAWSPDDHSVALSTEERTGDPSAVPPIRHSAVSLMSVPGGKPVELLSGGEPSTEGFIVAGWAGDGSHVIAWRDPGFSASLLADGAPLISISVNGGAPKEIAPAVLVFEDALASRTMFPDIAIVSGSGRSTWAGKSLVVYSTATSDAQTLTSSVAVSSPSWSLETGDVAYVSMAESADADESRLHDDLLGRRLFVLRLRTGQIERLTDDPLYRDEGPRWMREGEILFARISADDHASLWILPSAGGQPTEVADELTALPGPEPGWLGYYGHIDWTQMFDWTPNRQ